MNSTLADSNSSLSCATRIVKNDSNKMKPRVDFYLWMFGQIHSKRLLIYMQFVLVGLAIYGLACIADPHFSTMPIPGLDGVSTFGTVNVIAEGKIINKTEVSRLDMMGKIAARNSESAANRRNLVLFFSVLYFASVICTICALSCMERTWNPGASKIRKLWNPALLLVPFMMSLVCLCFISVFITFSSVGFVYVWRRARYHIFTEPAAASFSWSFREKNGLLGMHTNSFGRFKPNPNRSFNGRGASWRSVKSTDRPTLRSYISCPNDLNSSRSSLISADLSLPDENPLNDAVSITIEGSEPASGYASYSAKATKVRRPLDTVLEEGESHDGDSDIKK